MSNPIRPAIPCYTCPVRDRALCAAFSDEAIAELFARAERLHVDPGRYLYEEGDPSPYVYKIVEGLLMLERLASNGRRQIMAFVYPGDLIGLTPDEQYNVVPNASSIPSFADSGSRRLKNCFICTPILNATCAASAIGS
ncbi:MAG: cyclic nucleotide-binding domain-containing protein [Alphaproteobacteria bacterium]|nr:MAG: cyclic nucleotide-binding domain-containing protein [Alphaproteobacteria bacterium]